MSLARSARMLVSMLATSSPGLAGLSAEGQQCGELTCGPHQFCSLHRLSCGPCTEVCVPHHRNYQQDVCDKQCQDYLHDMRYWKKTDQQDPMEALLRMEDDLERLTILVAIMFCLLVVCFLWLAFHACSSRRARCRRRNTTDMEADGIQLKSVDAKQPNGAAAAPPVISHKANTVPQYTLGRHNSSFLMATKHGNELKNGRGRHPSEDTCPGDYSAAYDNPGLSVTPPLDEDGSTSHPLAPRSPVASRGPPETGADVATGSQRQRSRAADSRFRSRDSVARVDSGRAVERVRRPLDIDVTDSAPVRPLHVV